MAKLIGRAVRQERWLSSPPPPPPLPLCSPVCFLLILIRCLNETKTQVPSDVYDNNSGSTTAAKISVLFRPVLDFSPRWTHKRPFRSVKSTCRRLIKARINDCHRRLNYYKTKLQQKLDKLKQLIPTDLLNTVLTISDKRADKTTEQCRTKTELKLTRLQRTKDRKRRKPEYQSGISLPVP